MIIQLQRALTPEELREEDCAICGLPFCVGSVVAYAMTDERGAVVDERAGLSAACPKCVEYLGSRIHKASLVSRSLRPLRSATLSRYGPPLKKCPALRTPAPSTISTRQALSHVLK